MTDGDRNVLAQLTLGPKQGVHLVDGSGGILKLFGDDSTYVVLKRLEGMQLITAERRPGPSWWYTITDRGREALACDPPPPPKASWIRRLRWWH